jgi:hypothetical protein
MNKREFQQNFGKRARLRPMAKRSLGETGIALPPVDDHWFIQRVDLKTGVTISNPATHHSRELPWDAIYNWVDDGEPGQRSGFLRLNVQVHIGGNCMRTEPTARPGEAFPDQFNNVQNWNRENDAAYVRSLFSSPQPTPAAPSQAGQSGIGPGALLLGLVCFGLGVWAASA